MLLSGPIGDHGIAVLAARNELGLETAVQSDVAPLNHLVRAMLAASDNVHVLRDPTRGGVASTLNEIARQSAREHSPAGAGHSRAPGGEGGLRDAGL